MAFDAFLKISTIPGECTDDKHKDWIEVIDYAHAVRQADAAARSTGGAATAARCHHKDFVITKTLDKASPKLALACCNGEHIAEVKLEICRATGPGGGTKYMEYRLSDVIVARVDPSGNADPGSPLPLEQVAFSYGKIDWTYVLTDHRTGKPGGNVHTHWDTVTNKGG